MRILLDESLPRRLRFRLSGHEVNTVVGCGWSGTTNGKLLSLAATRFDVFLTADRNLEYQQNLAVLPLSVLVLIVPNNRLESIEPLLPELLSALDGLLPRRLRRIGGG